jgi:Protein of unknown function (DUF1524)
VRVLRHTALAVLCGLALFAGGCDPLIGAPAGTGSGAAVVGQGRAAALAQLDTLSVGAWHSMSGYSRDRFPHWVSQGHGCDTRDVVLKRDGTGVVATGECTIASGRWVSPYDNVTVTDPSAVDIDHMVPLANAWRTGAADWTDQVRSEFANDLTQPELLAVTASSNRSKGDQDPSQWRPPNRAFWCDYAQRWIAVKAHWHLVVTPAEKTALQQMLETC